MGFLHEHIILPLSDLAKGESVHKYLRILREAESWSDEQMKDFQQRRLHQLLTYAAKEVPFYRDWFHDKGLYPATVSLKQLPIVDKTIMRQEGIERFAAEHFSIKRRIKSRSSGSTGEPFSYYNSSLASSVNTAAKLRTWYMSGYHLGDRYMKIANGSHNGKLKRLQDKINNSIYIPFYSLDDHAFRSILEIIEKRHPKYIRAYPIPLYLLAKYRNSHPGFYYKPHHIFTTGSTLPNVYRTEIEEAFGCDVIDSYSCEGTPNTYETPAHDGYLITGYYGIIEVLDDNNHPIIDGIGRVVSTDLWNMAHPFIRYDTQDLVEVKNGKIQRIMGRECDAIITADGTIYTVHNFSHFFTHEVAGVNAYQIVRHHNLGITFRLVTNSNYTSNMESSIINHWHSLLGVPVDIELVNVIPIMNNNKYLTIVNETTD